MTPEQFQRVEQLFERACRLPEGKRTALVNEECGDDPEVRHAVLRMLHEDARADSFLSTPALGNGISLSAVAAMGARRSDEPDLPQSIGGYDIVRIIGEGGMGVVYLAEQTKPVRRQVALKIIKLGMDTHQVIARFETERQALAMMNHPNVAKVLDGGVTEDGRPFFVMEHVSGVAITEFCDDHELTVPTRLRLFIQVCQAVQHAHQNGVIHRDIKPSNLLVVDEDGEPIPKVIDFGIAKAIRQRLTERTLFTEQGQLIGTPAYMSPEQAAGGGLEVDTRTDIYSLGALLYELLCGFPPFDPATLRDSPYDEICRTIREDEPPKPSTQFTRVPPAPHSVTRACSSATGEAVARHRGTEPASLARQLRGDLDWIVMKAMDKDRTRRYETAAGLAADIRRHLNHEPVNASPPSTVYRLRKFARRNRALVTGTVAVIAALIIGLIGTGWAMLDASAQRDRATAVSHFLQNMLTSANPRVAGKPDLEVRELLDEAAREIDRGSLAGQPLIEAAVRTILGTSYHALGLYATAEPHLRRAVDIRERRLGPSHADLATSLSRLAGLMASKGDSKLAESYHRRALAMRRELFPSRHLDIAQSLHHLGTLLHEQGRREEAMALHLEALEMRRALLDANHPDIAQSLHGLGVSLMDQGQFDEAEAMLREALAIRRTALHAAHPDLGATTLALAMLLNNTARYLEAEPLCREAVEIARASLGPEHRDVGAAMNGLAIILKQKGELGEATALMHESLGILRKTLGDEHPEVGAMLHNVANIHNEHGDYDRAVALMQEAMEIFRRQLGDDHPTTAHCMHNLAVHMQNKGDYDAAVSLYRRALGIRRKVLASGHPHIADSLRGLAKVLMLRREYAEAEKLAREAIDIASAGLPHTRGALVSSYAVLGDLLLETGKAVGDESLEEMLRESLRIGRETLPAGHTDIAESESRLGRYLTLQGRFDEAAGLLLNSYAALAAGPQTPRAQRTTDDTIKSIAELYEAWGKSDEAAHWRERLRPVPPQSDGAIEDTGGDGNANHS